MHMFLNLCFTNFYQVAEEFVGLVDAVHLAVAELGLVDAHPVGAKKVAR